MSIGESGEIVDEIASVSSALLLMRGCANWLRDVAELNPREPSIELPRADIERAATIIRRAAEFFDQPHYGSAA